MILKRWACLVLAFLLSCMLLPALAEEEAVPTEIWICLGCGSEADGDACPCCGTVRDVWTCFMCGERNISSECSVCMKSRDESLSEQAACGDPLRAFPAVRYLAALNRPEALCELARYYETGLLLPRDPEAVIACYEKACETCYGPAFLYLGKVYDRGDLVEQDEFKAMEYFLTAAEL